MNIINGNTKKDIPDLLESLKSHEVKLDIEPSITSVKEIKIYKNNIINYLPTKNDAPSNLILSEQISRSTTTQESLNGSIIATSGVFLSYIVPTSQYSLIKIMHIDSRNYAIIKALDGSFMSIYFIKSDLLAILDDSPNLHIIQVKLIGEKVEYHEVYLLKLLITFKKFINLSHNTGPDHSLIAWTQDNVTLIDLDISHDEVKFIGVKDFPVSMNVDFACIDSSAHYAIIAQNHGIIEIFHRNDLLEDFKKFSVLSTEHITNLPVIYLRTFTSSSGQLKTLLVVWKNRIILFDEISLNVSQSLMFQNEHSNLIPCNNFCIDCFPLIDTANNMLVLVKLKTTNVNTTISHIIAYRYLSRTLLFEMDAINTTHEEMILFEYHSSGVQMLKVRIAESPVSDNEIYFSPAKVNSFQKAAIASSSTSRSRSADPTPYSPVIILDSTHTVEGTSNSIVEEETKTDPESLTSESSDDENPQETFTDKNIEQPDEINQLSFEILDNITFLKKFITKKFEVSEQKLMSFVHDQFELKKGFDSGSHITLSKQINYMETRLRCLEENHIKLLRCLEPYTKDDQSRNSLGKFENSFVKFNEKINGIEKHFSASFHQMLNDKSLVLEMSKVFKEALKMPMHDLVKESLLPMVQSEFKTSFNSINRVFISATQEYISSISSHIDRAIATKTKDIESSPNASMKEISSIINVIEERIIKIIQSNVDSIAQNAGKLVIDAILDASNLDKHEATSSTTNLNMERCVSILTELLNNKKHQEALQFCIKIKNDELFAKLMEESSPSELFYTGTNHTPSPLILEFLSSITEKHIQINTISTCNHISEAIITLQVIDENIDCRQLIVFKQLERMMEAVRPSCTGAKLSKVLMVICLLQSFNSRK